MGSKRVLAFVVLGVLAIARPSDAGWLDIIWEMSGPQMIGVGGGCEWSLSGQGKWRCTVPVKRLASRQLRDEQSDGRWWVSTYGYVYTSTAYKDFEGNAVHGFGADPLLSFAHYRGSAPVRITHGAGFTFQRFWSDDFETVDNVGFKIQPINVEFRTWGTSRLQLEYNVRVYWDGFESSPPVMTKASKSEVVHGLGISFMF